MTRPARLAMVAVLAGVLAVTVRAASAEAAITVAAPSAAVIGDVVPVMVTVTDLGTPVAGATVVLSQKSTLAGVTRFVELVRATTGEDGSADLSYEQRSALETVLFRVEVIDSETGPVEFEVVSVGDVEQVYSSEVGIDLIALNGWVLIALVAGLWALILATVMRLRGIAAGEPDSDEYEKPKVRLVPYLLPGVLIALAVGLVMVLIRNPATHANIDGPALGDRVAHSHLGDLDPVVSPGLAPEFAVLTGDPGVDGARLYFGLGCGSCHGLDATSGVVGGDATGDLDDGVDEFLDDLRHGSDGMPSYRADDFTDAELSLIHAYLETLPSG